MECTELSGADTEEIRMYNNRAPWKGKKDSSSHHPNQRRHVPRTTRVAECPGMSTGLPSLSNLPMRGPIRTQAQNPLKPPTMCTTPEPAKSM